MRGEILGMERRRFWHDDDKLEIVMSVGVDGASVTQVAQRHDVTRQQVYAWRHDLKKKGLWSPDNGALFIPLNVLSEPSVPTLSDLVSSPSESTPVEVRLRGGRSLRFDSSMDAAALTQLVRAVEAA
ncbi:IS66-like element accessory protein TnpA [Yoonia sp. MH D7]